MKEQLLREIKEMTTPELLECYNPGNHVFTRHYQMSEREMKARIRNPLFRLTANCFVSADSHLTTKQRLRLWSLNVCSMSQIQS